MKFLTKWKIKSPYALTADEWDDWNAKNKEAYPVRWFLQKTILRFIDINYSIHIHYPIRDFIWNIKYKLIKKHQYHIIRPRTLKPNYYDDDTRMLHGMMQCFVDFFEVSSKHVDWNNSSSEHKRVYAEMKEIYNWWTVKYPKQDELTVSGEKIERTPKLPKQWGMMAAMKKKYENEPLIKKYDEVLKANTKIANEWEALEEEMLMRLIKIRKYMWD